MRKEVNKGPNLFYLFIKRIFDIIVGLIGCIILIPLSVIVKIMNICCKDYGPLFFTQKRIGKNGKEFKLYKYRTMVVNADDILMDILKKGGPLAEEYKKNKKLKNDPRITKAGRLIRISSVDEFPQMINCLMGHMSVVGNRPYLPREKNDMGNYYKDIIKTKPGLTGYWQVSGRSNVSFKNRLKLEKYYSNNASLLLDLKIFFKTFKVVFIGKGAK